MTQEIEFDRRLFGKTFNSIKRFHEENPKRLCLLMGSRGSGKTHAMVQYLIIRALQNKERFVIIRKTSESLYDNVIKVFFDYIDKWNLRKYVTYNKSEKRMFINDTEVMFKGLNYSDRVKGLENCNVAWVEEGAEILETDWNTLSLTLRSKKTSTNPIGQKVYVTFNPTSKNNWLYKRYYKERDPKILYLHSTFKDNPFLDQSYIDEILAFKDYDFNLFKSVGLGQWSNITSGQEMYKSFKPEKHCGYYKYNPELSLSISIDENVNPYLSCIVSQIENHTVTIIREYALEDPFNTLYDLAQSLIRDYAADHRSTFMIYGDATSQKKDVAKERGSNTFYILLDYLKQFNPQLCVPRANPSVSVRCQFIDQCFFGMQNVKIRIDHSAGVLIDDISSVKKAPDSTKLKQKVTDPRTSIRYEQYGHMTDALEYLIIEAFRSEYEDFKSGGKIIIPRYDLKTSKW